MIDPMDLRMDWMQALVMNAEKMATARAQQCEIESFTFIQTDGTEIIVDCGATVKVVTRFQQVESLLHISLPSQPAMAKRHAIDQWCCVCDRKHGPYCPNEG